MADEQENPVPPQAEQQQETATAPPPPPPPKPNGETESTIDDQVRQARAAIPVNERGVTPTAYADQIIIAKDRSRAYLMLPSHLHNNAAVMAALVGIAARFNLDPIMLASQTYVQNNRLCFQSQAFGAILYASGLLIGRLKYEFRGEGEELTCTVSGRFKDDPDAVFSATTPPLKEIHPGMVQKEGKTFVKGSPLWEKDAEQQIAYFAQRRWIRRYAPDVVMGMYTREEIAEMGVEPLPLTADRLGQLDTAEGWRDGTHVDLDLAAIAPEMEMTKETSVPLEKEDTAKPAARGRKPKEKPTARRVVKPRSSPPASPPNWKPYVADTETWIASITADTAAQADDRWYKERTIRDELRVPIGERSRLRALLDRKLIPFREKPKEGSP